MRQCKSRVIKDSEYKINFIKREDSQLGQMISGEWVDDVTSASMQKNGKWTRTPSVVRNWIAVDVAEFTPAVDRYHLYAAWNCPWAHRIVLTRALLGLEVALPVSFAAPVRTGGGWVFEPMTEYSDALFRYRVLHHVYASGDAAYTGRVTTPFLFDTKR